MRLDKAAYSELTLNISELWAAASASAEDRLRCNAIIMKTGPVARNSRSTYVVPKTGPVARNSLKS